MNREIYVNKLKEEIIEAINYFESNKTNSFYENTAIDKNSLNEIEQFFNEIKFYELPKIFESVNLKYGWFLNYYREFKRNSDISSIKLIAKFFLIISIISILVGLFVGVSLIF
jgi:hypothetical protein